MIPSVRLVLVAMVAGSAMARAPICRVSGIPTEHGYQAGQIATCDLDGDGAVDPATVLFECEPGLGPQ